jgi:hypothetical protein
LSLFQEGHSARHLNEDARESIGSKIYARRWTYHCLALFYIFLFEEELSVKIGEVDGVQVEQDDMAKTG